MPSENHLTVRDYFDRVIGGRPRNRKAISASRTKTSGSGGFQRILTARQMQRSTKAKARSGGLKIGDYLARPVQAKSKYNLRTATAPGDKAAADKDLFSVHPALCESKASVKKTAARSHPAPNDGSRLRAADLQSLPKQAPFSEYQRIKDSILNAAQKYNLPVNLITSVIRAESNFQVKALSYAGAQGLMQLMPDTARELGVKNPFNIEENIDGGSRYLRKMLDSFGGDLKLALAAYNAGPEAVIRYGRKVPPFRETQQYVNRVLRFTRETAYQITSS